MQGTQVRPDAAGGLREAKKAATRTQLTTAARRLAVEHGLDAVTVEMISSAAGVSVRTFFNYFETKDAAVLGPDQAVAPDAAISAFLAGRPTGALLDDLVALLDPSDQLAREGRDGVQQLFDLVSREPRVLAAFLTRGMAHEADVARLVALRLGLAEPTTACRTVAAAAVTVVRRGYAEWFADPGPAAPLRARIEQAARELVALVRPADPPAD
ncbi:TetR/AcrR family transcriptional regulator [Nakamurella leprariae]|uniref:TetR/AcrR family transcriptional regulator n=1 Tax=Nakamurella leprariae TaxID=2803911 RepID=UPI002E2CD06D|nr:helix-turn-helix domain-containing protein [Nakamurella leprariae]